MLDNRIQNKNHSISDINSIAKFYDDKWNYDLENGQEIIDRICILIDKLNFDFKYLVFKLMIVMPECIWDFCFPNSMRC